MDEHITVVRAVKERVDNLVADLISVCNEYVRDGKNPHLIEMLVRRRLYLASSNFSDVIDHDDPRRRRHE